VVIVEMIRVRAALSDYSRPLSMIDTAAHTDSMIAYTVSQIGRSAQLSDVGKIFIWTP